MNSAPSYTPESWTRFKRLYRRRDELIDRISRRQLFVLNMLCPQCMPDKGMQRAEVTDARIPSLTDNCAFCVLIRMNFEHFVGRDHNLYRYNMHISRKGDVQFCFFWALSHSQNHVHVQLQSPGMFFLSFSTGRHLRLV